MNNFFDAVINIISNIIILIFCILFFGFIIIIPFLFHGGWILFILIIIYMFGIYENYKEEKENKNGK